MIRLENVSKQYGESVILENSSFTFPKKGLVCILGPSGCGKSTLLNLIAGFDSDYKGKIIVGGYNLTEMNADELCSYRRDNVGFVFQKYQILNCYTALENILLATEITGENRKSSEKRATKLLQRLGLSGKEEQKSETLSGGQKQRVAIARALINNPSILLADEPTGALDRKNAVEIMELLKELSQDRLVIVITHDAKCAAYGTQIVSIQDGKLVGKQPSESDEEMVRLIQKNTGKVPLMHWAVKNFQVRLSRYLAISAAIAMGVLCFTLSLSSGNIMEQSIADFEVKNTAFHNGSIKAEGEEDKILSFLHADGRLENIYPQYVLSNISVKIDGEVVDMAEKYPMAKAAETLSYGVMPRRGKQEIALSPSLASKFSKDIQNLLGKTAEVSYAGYTYSLTISGIFNASYDDFYTSSDVEQKMYTGLSGKVYAVSYDVIRFEDIASVSDSIKEQGFTPQDASVQASAFLSTFQNLRRLFVTISLLILGIGILISIILLLKQQNTRFREIGLLSAMGYERKAINRLLLEEGLLVCGTTAAFGGVLSSLVIFIAQIFGFSLLISPIQVLTAIILSMIVIFSINVGASLRLIRAEPATALRK